MEWWWMDGWVHVGTQWYVRAQSCTHTHTCREADYAKCVRFGIVSQVMALLRQAVRSVAQAGHFLGIRLYQVYSIYLTWFNFVSCRVFSFVFERMIVTVVGHFWQTLQGDIDTHSFTHSNHSAINIYKMVNPRAGHRPNGLKVSWRGLLGQAIEKNTINLW